VDGGTIHEDVAFGGTIGTAFASAGQLVAALPGVDPDFGDTLTYSIVGGDSAKYEILNGNEIHVKAGVTLDYEIDSSDAVTIRVTDSHGAIFNQNVPISITNYAGSFTGTAAAETITGTSEEDTINAGAGDDTIIGFVGADTVDGGAGWDTIVLTATSATLNSATNAQ